MTVIAVTIIICVTAVTIVAIHTSRAERAVLSQAVIAKASEIIAEREKDGMQ